MGKIFLSPDPKDNLIRFLRTFKTKCILDMIEKETSTMMIEEKSDLCYGARETVIESTYFSPEIENDQRVIITAWDLVDLAYFSIKYSNDYRGKDYMSDDEFKIAVLLLSTYNNHRDGKIIKSLNSNEKILYLWGFGGEQFKFQNVSSVFDNNKRELYVLFEYMKEVDKTIDIEKIVFETFGIKWEYLLLSILCAWVSSVERLNFLESTKKIKYDENFSVDDYKRVIEYYTVNYFEIKSDDTFFRQKFYIKPYVENQNGVITFPNCFLNLCLYENCIYWIVRNHFLGTQKFTNAFGKCFELYFEKVLSDNMDESQYEKTPRSETAKRSDWKVKIGKYSMLVEQKASLVDLDYKKQGSDVERIKKYVRNNILVAMEQLNSTEKYYGEMGMIKVILLYETYVKDELLDSVFLMDECQIMNDYNYWLVTIDEMELLLSLYKENLAEAEKVIEEKIIAEHEQSIEGKGLTKFLNAHGCVENKYLNQPKFEEYNDRVFKLLN